MIELRWLCSYKTGYQPVLQFRTGIYIHQLGGPVSWSEWQRVPVVMEHAPAHSQTTGSMLNSLNALNQLGGQGEGK